MTEIPDHPKNTLFSSSNSDWSNKTFSENSKDDWPRVVVDSIDRLCCDGGVRDPEGSRTLVATTWSRARAPAEAQAEAEVNTVVESDTARPDIDRPASAKTSNISGRSVIRIHCSAGV